MGRERALSQGVAHAPREGVTWSTCSNRISLNFKFLLSEHRDSGAAAPALQQSLEQQPLPVARGLPGVQWHWGPWDGAPACQVRAHTHTVTSTNLLVTREQSSRWRKDGAARDGSRAPSDGMGWRVLKQEENKGRRM